MHRTTARTRPDPRRWLLRGAFVLLAIPLAALTGVLSYGDLARRLQETSLSNLAARIERREDVDPGLIETVAEAAARSAAQVGCDDLSNRAALSVRLAVLQIRSPAEDFEAWADALRSTQTLVRHALSCSPADGNFWTQLALAERAVSVDVERLGELLHLSARLSPAELDVLAVRTELWRATPWLDGELADLRVTDLRRILRGAYPPDVARMLRHPNAAMRREIEEELPALPARRVNWLRHAGLLADSPGRSAADGLPSPRSARRGSGVTSSD